jgi:toxin ParE1/3/4
VHGSPPRARADLEEIWRSTFGRWSPDQADRYHQGIVDVADELATGAKAGCTVEIRAGYRNTRSDRMS